MERAAPYVSSSLRAWVEALHREGLTSPVYKPALLLIVLDQIDAGRVDPGHIPLDSRIANEFDALLVKAGVHANPGMVWRPFFHLGTTVRGERPMWTLHHADGTPWPVTGADAPSSLTGLKRQVAFASFAPRLASPLRTEAGRVGVRELIYDLLTQHRHADAHALLAAHDREWREVNDSISLIREASERPFALHVERPRVELSARTMRSRDRGFRMVVLPEYEHRCAACELRIQWGSFHEAEAAHIVPVEADGADDVRNALALCRTHHWAFDLGLWTVGNDRLIRVVEGDVDDDLTALQALRGKALRTPSAPASAPHAEAFAYHREHRYKGTPRAA